MPPTSRLSTPFPKYDDVTVFVERGTKRSYLDLLEGGRARALAGLQADATFDAILQRFACPYSARTVEAEAQRVADERTGGSAGQHPAGQPPR